MDESLPIHIHPRASFELEVPDVSLEDIGGLDAIGQGLLHTIQSALQPIGPHTPRGALICGLPGTGKTLLAKAIGHECNTTFIHFSRPQLVTMWFESSSRATVVRDIFDKARSAGPCVLFFDDIDNIHEPRKKEKPPAHLEDTLFKQFIFELDRPEANTNIFVLAATARPDRIHPSLLSPNRLSHLIVIPFPDEAARLSILNVALCKSPVSPLVDREWIVRSTEGFHGSDLVEVCQRAAKLAIRESIESEERERGVGAGGDGSVEDREGEEEEDPIEITPAHFEEALKYARRSLSSGYIRRFEMNTDKLRLDAAR